MTEPDTGPAFLPPQNQPHGSAAGSPFFPLDVRKMAYRLDGGVEFGARAGSLDDFLSGSSPFLSCSVCARPARYKCPRCTFTRYCGRAHFVQDWETHGAPGGVCAWVGGRMEGGDRQGNAETSPSRARRRQRLSFEFWTHRDLPADRYSRAICYLLGGHAGGIAERDHVRAAELVESSAGAGYARAQFAVGVAAAVRMDFDTAAANFLRAAAQGMVDAQFFLGLCYEAGTGIGRDRREGLRLVRAAAARDSAGALFTLGRYLECGVPGLLFADAHAAVLAYERAAELGSPDAKRSLALCLHLGEGVLVPDHDRAFRLMAEAAEAGVALARGGLGSLHELGIGTPVDLPRALALYLQDAEDSPVAQYNLGRCCLFGRGLPAPDAAAAIRWFTRAARSGLRQARDAIAAAVRFRHRPVADLPADLGVVQC